MTMRHYQPSLVLAFVAVLVLLCIKPYEACRSVPGGNEQEWVRKNHLSLPSLEWKPVTPPKSNAADLGEKNFAAAATEKQRSSKKHILLPSLWKPVSPPKSNPGTNSALAGAKSFAAAATKKPTHILLPSLQWRPVTSPSPNPGHNAASTVSEQNFATGKTTTAVRPPPSSKHHSQQLPAVSHKAAS